MARDFAQNSTDVIKATLASDQTTLTNFTFSVWFNADTYANYNTLVNQGSDYPARNWNLEIDTSRTDQFQMTRFYGSGDFSRWEIPEPSVGSWSHITVSHNGGKSTLPVAYLNGSAQSVSQRNTASGSTLQNTSTKFSLGQWYDTQSVTGGAFGLRGWDGKIAEFAMWNRIIGTDEMLILSKGFSPLFITNGLVLYKPLFGENSPEQELIYGSGGTVTGAVKSVHPRIIYPTSKQMRWFSSAAAPATAVKDVIQPGIIPFAR